MWPCLAPRVVTDDRSVTTSSPRARLAPLARAAEAALLPFSAICLVVGALAHLVGQPTLGDALWILATVVSAIRLARRDRDRPRAGSTGVDVVALLAMGGSIALGEYLAGVVIAVMYATGQSLERYAHGRAERELRRPAVAGARASPTATRRDDLVDRPAEAIVAGDRLLIKPGEVVPVDGIVVAGPAALDESALTGESRIVVRDLDDRVASGVVNAGGAFDLRRLGDRRGAAPTPASSGSSGSRRREKSPFVRIADRYAGVFLVVSLGLAGLAWVISGDPVRALAVLVVATPCPLLLAAPIAIVAGISRSARRGVIVKGGGALEALGRARVLLMDKTGTLTTGPAAARARRRAAGRRTRTPSSALAASLDQLSPHVLALAIVHAARERALAARPADRGGRGRPASASAVGSAHGRSRSAAASGSGGVGRCRTGRARAIERVELEGSMAILVEVDGELAGILVWRTRSGPRRRVPSDSSGRPASSGS